MSCARSAALAEVSGGLRIFGCCHADFGGRRRESRCSEFCYFAGNHSSSGATTALGVAELRFIPGGWRYF